MKEELIEAATKIKVLLGEKQQRKSDDVFKQILSDMTFNREIGYIVDEHLGKIHLETKDDELKRQFWLDFFINQIYA